MYLRWAIAMLALWFIAQRCTPRPLADLLMMRGINARMEQELAR